MKKKRFNGWYKSYSLCKSDKPDPFLLVPLPFYKQGSKEAYLSLIYVQYVFFDTIWEDNGAIKFIRRLQKFRLG